MIMDHKTVKHFNHFLSIFEIFRGASDEILMKILQQTIFFLQNLPIFIFPK